MQFSEWLQLRMRERGLSQADLARATDRSANIVSLWCRGLKRPGVSSVPRIALALGLNEMEVLRALHGDDGAEHSDLFDALRQRLPDVPLSPSEIRLVCTLVEGLIWSIRRWDAHEEGAGPMAAEAISGAAAKN